MLDLSPSGIARLVVRGIRFELRLYRSLLRWTARRPSIPGPALTPVGYARDATPLMLVWIFASAIEVPFFHLLIPWDWARILLLAVSLWGFVWMLGLLASLRVYPHLLAPTGLRIRHGATVDIGLPWSAIASIGVNRADLPSSARTLQPVETDSGTHLRVGVSGHVNVHVVLRSPTTVPTPKGAMTITELSFLADEPRDVVAMVRQQLSSPAERR